MDDATLVKCHDHVGSENVESTLPPDFVAANLAPTEKALWQKCADRHSRLEQEHIPREVMIPALNALAASVSQKEAALDHRRP
jgi:hypothetical protein